MKTVSLGLVSVLSTGLVLFLLSTMLVSAQPLVMNTPTGNMTDGAYISINPEEPLPANGTVSISTEEVADTDMNVIPPEGVTVVIESDTVTVTNQTVDIETAEDDTGDGGSGDGGSEVAAEMVAAEMVAAEMVAAEMVGAEMVTQERKIHQKKGNKIPYLLFVPRLHELTKATQFIDLFNEDGRSSLYYFHSSFKNLSLYKAISTVSLWSENSLSIFSLNCLTNALYCLSIGSARYFRVAITPIYLLSTASEHVLYLC